MSGISAATVRTSGMKIIHRMFLTAVPDRMDKMTVEMTRMLRPTCGGKEGSESAGVLLITN